MNGKLKKMISRYDIKYLKQKKEVLILKYINQLNDNQLLELMKPYISDGFRKLISIDKYDDNIIIYVEIELDDDEYEGEKMIVEDGYELYDYDVRIYDYQATNENELLKKYRQYLLNYFENQYALDYLLDI